MQVLLSVRSSQATCAGPSTASGAGHGDGLYFLQLSIVVRYPGAVCAKPRSVGILFRASIWRLLRLGELDDLRLQRNSARVRFSEP